MVYCNIKWLFLEQWIDAMCLVNAHIVCLGKGDWLVTKETRYKDVLYSDCIANITPMVGKNNTR